MRAHATEIPSPDQALEKAELVASKVTNNLWVNRLETDQASNFERRSNMDSTPTINKLSEALMSNHSNSYVQLSKSRLYEGTQNEGDSHSINTQLLQDSKKAIPSSYAV